MQKPRHFLRDFIFAFIIEKVHSIVINTPWSIAKHFFFLLCGWQQFDIFLFTLLRPSYLTPIKICQVFFWLLQEKSFEDIKYLQSRAYHEQVNSCRLLPTLSLSRLSQWLVFPRYAIYSKWNHELFIEWQKINFIDLGKEGKAKQVEGNTHLKKLFSQLFAIKNLCRSMS